MDNLMNEILTELKKSYGENAEFREGQAEAIIGVLEGKRTLVVQKTGWGKSLVYFMATKILRKQTGGFTLIISPLLALMDNQIDAASKLGLNVKTINSSNTDEYAEIVEEIKQNKVDALIISPERLANPDFKADILAPFSSQIRLFVVDEAHCISDWGHDFRPDYRRIVDIIQLLPPNVPVLATTATANDRVIADIKAQMGNEIQISRGSLMRESLALQVVKLDSKEERLAWIARNINSIPGTGIIYCLTIRDCDLVNNWLRENNISSESFYSTKTSEEKNDIVKKFTENRIKVLVATIAFGMGYDKADIGFVIHFQKPANVVAYYQQIGRAGRALENAYAILMCGYEDDEINNYFINTAFPTEDLMSDIIRVTEANPGIKRTEYQRYINMKQTKIENCLKYLTVKGDIYTEFDNRKTVRYYKASRNWNPDLDKSRKITKIRQDELQQMNDFIELSDCYMEYIARCLDDTTAQKCKKCSNCKGAPLFDEAISNADIAEAKRFISESFNIIEPRKQWPSGANIDGKMKIDEEFLCCEGRVLSDYGDAGWGKTVAKGKYKDNHFGEELVEASCKLLKPFVQENEIKWVTNIPSLRRPDLVKDFAKKLAEELGLKYAEAIKKVEDSSPQKELNNSFMQQSNAFNSFEVIDSVDPELFGENVLLVDDMVDSRWTITCCGYKLRKNGSGKVYPFALANTAGSGDD